MILLSHEHVCLMKQRFERYFFHIRVQTYMNMSRIFKENMRTWTKTIQLTNKKKLRNVTT